MKNVIILYTLLFFGVTAGDVCAQTSSSAIRGFRYGREATPTGKEWESPEDLALNKEEPHAYFFSFGNKEDARKVLPEHSMYWQSLNGTWKFNWVKTPEDRPEDFYKTSYDVSGWDDVPVPMSWNIYGIQKDGSLKSGVPIYVNQRVIFQHQVKVDDWRGGVMRTPPQDWTTYIYRNEVGSYRRDFTVPKDWDGREVYINFDGVDSFFYLWINGQYVGFSKNSRNLASFNITAYLNKDSKNTVAVEVYRNSDASFIEAQDMFRLPGIFRTVSLTSKPKVQIRDLQVISDLSDDHQQGKLRISTYVQNLDKKKIKDYSVEYSLYANVLYQDDHTFIKGGTLQGASVQVMPGTCMKVGDVLELDRPHLWSAERPYRYTLVAELRDQKGHIIETVSTHVGFRKVEIRETRAEDDEFGFAGRYFYVNGKPVKLKGVNRHETDPEKGKVLTHEQMEEEVRLMKRANINHVRNSHYPDDPYWYYLCDRYGIYLEDEANIESHEYYYGKESLSHPPEWRNAHVARNLEMVHATINHPSIVIWSLGNEAGPGNNFVAAYNAIKQIDDSRPVQYERNNNIVDIGSNQYPSIEWVRGAVKGAYKLKYPFHISEYAHSMGNAAGNLIDYWEAIESTNFFMGGALWDWRDQSMYYYDKETGERFFAYGGDFGDRPNDGTFVNNGLIFADMKPKPQYYEVKKVYQNVGVKAVDALKGTIEIFNKNYFVALDDYDIVWSLYRDGVQVKDGRDFVEGKPAVEARHRKVFTVPIGTETLDAQSEYFVKIQFLLAQDELWAKKGYVQMEEQLFVKDAEPRPSLASVQSGSHVSQSDENNLKVLSGKGYVVRFDMQTGTIHSLDYADHTIIRAGEGPKLDALRAPLDNDNWAYKQWFEKGLHNLEHKALSHTMYTRPDGAIVLSFVVESQAPYGASIQGGTSGTYTLDEHTDRPFGTEDFRFTTNQVWTVYPDGSIELQSNITSNDEAFALARLGYAMQLPEDYGNYTYYGRGPVNNYADRRTAQNIELHTSTVKDQFVPWPNPQSMSNNEEVRWTALTDTGGNGAVFIAHDVMSTSALPWSELEVTLASHPYKLPRSSGVHLHLDAAVTGLGGNSCGQGPPLEQDRVKARTTAFGFTIRPVIKNDYRVRSNVSASGDVPLGISRGRSGEVVISSARKGAEMMYRVDSGKSHIYAQPFDLRAGGRVTAWYKDNDKLRSAIDFPKIETVPLEVVFASSQETGEGSAAHFTDGNPNTIWHTMYSVTVAQYPHWVDFDAGESKSIKGFSYLPRQNGANGHIKEYRIQISEDGKSWGEPIAEGHFAKGNRLQIIHFAKPVKGRYVRFTALSSQDGQDFASGAEFNVLVD